MQRVAALYLPSWPLDRLRRAERHTPPEPSAPPDLEAVGAAMAEEHARGCSVPRGGGWRPGARWAREDRAAAIAALPAHQRPPMAELGRRDVAADHAFKAPDGRCSSSSAPAPDVQDEDGLPPRVTRLHSGNRLIVAAASASAQALGLRPGMALAQARAQVAGLEIHAADPEGDRADLERLALALARRWTPTVALSGDDTLFLDLTGVAHLHGGEARMGRRLVRMLARLGVTARIAMADTPGAAWAIAHFPPPEGWRQGCWHCLPGDHPRVLAALPIEALRIEPAPVELLHRLGVTRIAQLAAMPRAPLARRFGAALVQRLAQGLGEMAEPLHPVVPPEPITVEQRFAEPIASPEAIAHWLGELVPRLCAELAQAGLGARAIELLADRVDGVPQRLRIGLARPSRDPTHLARLLLRRIETIAPGYGLDALRLHLRRAEPLGPETIGGLDSDAAPDLAPLVDTLATRIGTNAMWRMRPVESDVPERSAARAPVLDPPERRIVDLKPDDVRRLDRNGTGRPVWHPDWPRPARLLRRPEPVDHVIAELPDQPPRRFTWRGHSHQVVRADGPERIHGEWWRRSKEAHGIRDYFQVEDEAGHRYWLFRRGDGERTVTGDMRWYLHGVFG